MRIDRPAASAVASAFLTRAEPMRVPLAAGVAAVRPVPRAPASVDSFEPAAGSTTLAAATSASGKPLREVERDPAWKGCFSSSLGRSAGYRRAAFVSACLVKAGQLPRGAGVDGVRELHDKLAADRRFVPVRTADARPGDVVILRAGPQAYGLAAIYAGRSGESQYLVSLPDENGALVVKQLGSSQLFLLAGTDGVKVNCAFSFAGR